MSVIKLTREINGLIWDSISRLANARCKAGEERVRGKASHEVMYLLSWDDLHVLLPISAHLWICIQTRRDWAMHSGDILDRREDRSVSASMAAAGERIVRRLGGTWSNGRGMCRCPAHEDRTPSLSVRCGRTSLLFKCFAGCTIGEILGALRSMRLDVPRGENAKSDHWQAGGDTTGYAMRLWGQGRSVSGTPAERYLRSRSVSPIYELMRYHPATPLGRGRTLRYLPALLIAVGEPRRPKAIQRTFLQLNGRPALLAKTKRSLGPLRGDAVQILEPEDTLGLAEGVENALSAALLLAIPVWASLGAERFHRIDIPTRIKRLVLLADNDRAGRRAVTRALESYALTGRDIIVLWPAAPFNDWNEALRAGGKAVRERARLAA